MDILGDKLQRSSVIEISQKTAEGYLDSNKKPLCLHQLKFRKEKWPTAALTFMDLFEPHFFPKCQATPGEEAVIKTK